MGHQTTAFIPNRKTSKTLTWAQEEVQETAKRRVRGKAQDRREKLTEELAERGIKYRDR